MDIEDYYQFLKFQSISSEPTYREHVLACAAWLENYLKIMGFQTQVWETPGYPTLFASWEKAGPEKPTLLIYNHYDVQPVDPLSLWDSPPFEPTLKNGEVYARGAQDNKGQCFYVLQALKKTLKEKGKLPINIKLCIEGEEECGSPGLARILPTYTNQLKADYLAIVDLGIPKSNVPSITLGIRGLVAIEVEVEGSSTDLHSGSHGGIVYNPIHALVQILAKIRDPSTGRILIPGFYDDVVEIHNEDKKNISFDFDEATYLKTFSALPSGGEQEFLPLERNWLRPTLEINGISGGYTGTGFKTVIPAKACAKISCRLVPNQSPHEIGELVCRYLQSVAPKGIRVRADVLPGGGEAVRAQPSSKIVKTFAQAFSEVFQAPCKYIYDGASIPIVPELSKACGGDTVLLGLGLADDKIHAPNEHFGLDRIQKGAAIISRVLELL